MDEKFYTPQEVAKLLNIAYMTVYRWIQSGKLRAFQLEKQYRIEEKDLKNFIEKGDTVKLPDISASLARFIGSGMMDYAYVESRKFPIDLTLGVNPLGCSPKVTEYYQKRDIHFTNYSEVISESLRKKISEVYGFDKNEVLLGAGASDLLHLCYVTFMNPGEDVIMPEITFPPLEFLAILSHGNAQFMPLKNDFDVDYKSFPKLVTDKSKIAVFCNPNNPTGKQLGIKETETIIKNYPDIVFLIDEANIDFGGTSFISLTKKYHNLVVLRSFSKGFGLAGLRIGFTVGHKDMIYALQRRQTPFSVNVFAQKLAEVSLDDMEFLKKTYEYTKQERKYLEINLKQLNYSSVQSDSNYILVNISNKFPSSKEFIKILNEKGANVVDGNDFKGLYGKYIRLSIRTHETNKKFIEVLKNTGL